MHVRYVVVSRVLSLVAKYAIYRGSKTLTYEVLLDKANSSTKNVKRLRFLCVEIYKTINNLDPSFMKQIFELGETNRNVREECQLNLNIPNNNQFTFGKKVNFKKS